MIEKSIYLVIMLFALPLIIYVVAVLFAPRKTRFEKFMIYTLALLISAWEAFRFMTTTD